MTTANLSQFIDGYMDGYEALKARQRERAPSHTSAWAFERGTARARGFREGYRDAYVKREPKWARVRDATHAMAAPKPTTTRHRRVA